jgi:hypothetical protein
MKRMQNSARIAAPRCLRISMIDQMGQHHT